MKSKHSYHSKKKVNSNSSENIDLRIPKMSYNFSINDRPLRRKMSKPKPKLKKKGFNPTYTINKTHQMNWQQLKQKYPGMKPYSDSDFDGLVNSKDCRPLDPSRDGVFSRFLNVVTAGKKGQSKADFKAERVAKSSQKFEKKMERDIVKEKDSKELARAKAFIQAKKRKSGFAKYKVLPGKVTRLITSKVSRNIRERVPTTRREIVAAKVRRERRIVTAVERFAGVKSSTKKKGKASKGQKQAGAGRPKQSYKYKDPRTGQPISAVQYHKLRKQLKSQAKAVETRTEVKQRFALARRGLSPEEVAEAQEAMNTKMAKLRAIKDAKQQGVEVTEDSPEFEEQVVQQEAQQIPEEVVQEAIPQDQQQVPQQVQTYQPQHQRSQRIEPMLEVPGSRGIPPGYRVQDNLMTGERTLVPLPPREAWTR